MQKIKVGWRQYKVAYLSRVMYEGAEVYGTTDCEFQRIEIDKTEGIEQQQITLLHECIHALDREYSLLFEEITVKSLARAIYTLFRENPKLLKKIWDSS
jgi:hypothetical protein